jgi:hypothetical protein
LYPLPPSSDGGKQFRKPFTALATISDNLAKAERRASFYAHHLKIVAMETRTMETRKEIIDL